MTTKEKNIIRELAKQYMEMASSEEQAKMDKRMLDTNDLKIVRPPVLLDEIPWYQIDIDNELTNLCEDPRAQKAETILRRNIYRRKHFRADTLFEPFFRVTMAYDSTGIGLEPQHEILRTDAANKITSHNYTDLLEDEDSVNLLRVPEFTARPDVDEDNMNFYTELFGDSMPVKLCGRGFMYDAPWDRIACLRDLENILYDLYDRPEHLHAIRQKYLDATIAEMDFIENHFHVDPTAPNMHCTPARVSGLAEDGLKATWYRTMAQGFSQVSPEMFEEFDINYTLQICERFAYVYYGCCEPLDNKLDAVLKIPNLRKVGVSPWANQEAMAERLGGKYVFARKPNPANVAMVTDPEVIRKETENTVKLCQKYGCPVEFVIKDISTVSHRPENLIVWSNVVSEVLDAYYGK